MKKAFTLLELVLVVTIAGILSLASVVQLKDRSLRQAAEQILFHIRYTQHLAMADARFDLSQEWYKTRWQLLFSNCGGTKEICAYSVFSDWTGMHTGNPDPQELAINPLNRNQLLTGGMGGNRIIKYYDKEATKQLNIGQKYQIKKVRMNHCGSTAKRIAFDHLGRPVMGNLRTMKSPYQKRRLLKRRCEIQLIHQDNRHISIAIEPETGYAYILP